MISLDQIVFMLLTLKVKLITAFVSNNCQVDGSDKDLETIC